MCKHYAILCRSYKPTAMMRIHWFNNISPLLLSSMTHTTFSGKPGIWRMFVVSPQSTPSSRHLLMFFLEHSREK